MTRDSSNYRPAPTPAPSPTCIRLGGCLGATACHYCGAPQPVPTVARERLAALIASLQRAGVKA